MSDESAPTIHQYSAPPPCLVCGDRLLLRLARGRKSGKPFVMLRCGRDGRHFRAFVNDRAFVDSVLARLEGNTPSATGSGDLDDGETPSRRSTKRLLDLRGQKVG